MSATNAIQQGKSSGKAEKKWIWMLLATVAMIIVLLLPTPAGLAVAGQRALAVLVFAVILWMSEAVSYPVSAALVLALATLLLGLAPSLDDPHKILGTKESLDMALSGFSNSAVALVAGALFLAAAMQVTGLDKRIALVILSKVGSSTRGILFGAIMVAVVLSFLVPSTTARVGAIVPIILGMVAAFGLEKNSRFAALIMIASAQAASIWNIGVKTAAAQNMVAIGFMEKAFHTSVTWGEWFLYAAPWAIVMSVVLYFVMLKVIPPEMKNIPNGQQMVQEQLKALGKLTGAETRLLIISLVLLFLWATEKVVHPLDSTTTMIIAVAVMLTPKIGVFTWSQVEKYIPWGTIILFAVGISLGTILLKTKAATWLANAFFSSMGLDTMPILAIIAILALFNIVIHLGFASATSLASTLIPIVIALVQGLDRPDMNLVGMVLIQQFVVSFGFILPVNAPQNMVAFGTGTFTTKDFIKSGIPLTVIGYLLLLLFAATYWKWMGLL
ncbi:DASS family sodium-coupled anion symporter [Brevibacillus ginsengisoli]|uniref:DASS family sodium-coupled anion symporter n=1 Tax=Brevibacillus ginsengisoli TaxID=363854 RepID=UPI003CF257E0